MVILCGARSGVFRRGDGPFGILRMDPAPEFAGEAAGDVDDMHIGNLILISPAIYLTVAAVVVLLIGVIAAANPKGKLEHYLAAHYLAPALMVPALVLTGGVIY